MLKLAKQWRGCGLIRRPERHLTETSSSSYSIASRSTAGGIGTSFGTSREKTPPRGARVWCSQTQSPSSSSSSTASPASPQQQQEKRRRPIDLSLVEVVDVHREVADWNSKVLLIDKPLDWTSFDVCGKLRGLTGIKKVGHAGTLDPQATGLLIVCVGKAATRAVDHFQGLEKAYEGTLRLGEETASYDACTPVERSAEWSHLTDSDIEAAASSFLGETMQLPPMYSAIKRRGRKLYELARKGITVEREPRPIRIDEFKVWRNEGEDPQTVHFAVRCSKGTYIRCLAHDLGTKLQSAAHMTSLRRTQIGEYNVDRAWRLQALIDHMTTMQQEREKEASSME